MRNEHDFTKQVADYLAWRGDLFLWRNNTGQRGGVRFGKKGSADFIGLHNSGTFVGIELKFGKRSEQKDEQKDFQRRVEEKGGIYILAYTLDELQEKLAAAIKERGLKPYQPVIK